MGKPDKPFDRFMVAIDLGRNRKMRRRFTPEERWAWVGGVLCIAADAPIRGCFVVTGEPATAEDVADEAGVSLRAAASALQKFRSLEMIVEDEDLGCEVVRDWSDYNPEPKHDPTNAERQARFRAKRNGVSTGVGNAGGNAELERYGQVVTLRVTPPEVEGEVEGLPPDPPRGEIVFPDRPTGNRQRDLDAYAEQVSVFRVASESKLDSGLLEHCAALCRRSGRQPTLDNLAPLLERYGPQSVTA